ncbi:uncharacterized protein LOC110461119 [Mizuhopecten yessoensis]|uniref:uncharacterized protein LOC110461119 n=1 Tax=Mizuhopecten yessoensis TaxID=6573 RepID=UPI000B45763C|nr:uncharacterized protein LOC110461119 [Mizuhopecten yessoensis]
MAKRPKKIVYGDQIQRSEYNDGVLRNNNRANNRLSREMLMYEKAQKVILKDLGKETQLLRSKLSMSTIASPRLAFAKNTTTDIAPFTIYGMSANPKSKKEPARKVTLKPIYPSVVEGSATPRASFNPRTSFVNPRNHVVVSSSSRNGLADSRVEKVNSRNGLLDSRNNILDSRNELVDGSVSARSGALEPRISSRTNMNNSRNSAVQLNALTTSPGKLTSSKSRRAMKSGKTGVSNQESESEFSTVEARGGRASVVSDIKSRQAPSRLSFIDILAEAEERKAKEAKLELEANSSTTTMLRPKTPILTIDGDVTASPDDVNEEYKSSRRGSHIGATPKATAVTVKQK